MKEVIKQYMKEWYITHIMKICFYKGAL